MTVPMVNPETGKTGDIHPDEIENMKAAGWRLMTAAELDEGPATDAEMRSAMKATGQGVEYTAYSRDVLGDNKCNVPALAADVGASAMTDADLRKAIKKLTGKAPGPNARRKTLEAKFNELSGS